MSLTFASPDPAARPIHVLAPGEVTDWLSDQPDAVRARVSEAGFEGQAGRSLVVAGPDGRAALALLGIGDEGQRRRGRFALAALRRELPEGTWRIATPLDPEARDEAALGWLLAGYVFDRYADAAAPKAMLVAPDGVDAARIEAIAAGEAFTRDLINTPANDMGPDTLEAEARKLAGAFGAAIAVVAGDDLLAENLPLIHAVGRAATDARGPRLIDLRWGEAGPKVTLVGKGVCFDTGGLNLKPGASMGIMKKDMGGAATVLGLARTIMALGLEMRLRVLVPAVENSVSAASFRPGDILTARSGKTIEINNTDAEGRLVLADALTLGGEDAPDVMVSMATLTGAARVAVGPDLAPFYTDDEGLASGLMEAGRRVRDPLWRMPFWDPYEAMIEPGIADLDNAPSGGFAGSITAALFLRRFAGGAATYAHFDIYGWTPSAAPGRPKGGVGQGGRALLEVLPGIGA
ncbi:leucyl aminopeptidase [Palleronia aestuarii]|uniref:Leucyl aminopeptidase n=1 Tax=Palleronia aestuarii TaxID=568105 RepID=A0A2W7NUX3_9RHOB|nr:leucyl aminopeptidase family protein [Palleronia aestuarii]PZX15032.1 leucyl aminopeptidase [Palleronia aestuarii]